MKNIIYTVTQINNTISYYLTKSYQDVWIKGNISNLKTYPSGHSYFILKDELSEIQCVIFGSTNILNPSLKNNSNVTIVGDLSIYANKGQFQIIVKNIFYKGESKLWMNFLELKDRLKRQGKFELKYKKDIPKIPSKIAILASEKSAALQDIINILKRRAPFIEIFVYNIISQGHKSAKSIIEQLFVVDNKNYDLVILTRGGGSIEDLMSFNDENLVNYIFELETPILTAIGHQTDITLCDYVSDKYASTPSEAAELCSTSTSEINEFLNAFFNNFNNNLKNFISNYKNKIDNYKYKIDSISPALVVENISNRLTNYNIKLNTNINDKLLYLNNRIVIYDKILENINLVNKKKQGFSIIKKKNKIINSINHVSENDILDIEVYDGVIKSKVVSKI